jgi:hypothetical protein
MYLLDQLQVRGDAGAGIELELDHDPLPLIEETTNPLVECYYHPPMAVRKVSG